MYKYVWPFMTMYDFICTMYEYRLLFGNKDNYVGLYWLCMYGFVWLYMNIYDYVWHCMTDYVWLCITLYDSLRHDYVWIYRTNGRIWKTLFDSVWF